MAIPLLLIWMLSEGYTLTQRELYHAVRVTILFELCDTILGFILARIYCIIFGINFIVRNSYIAISGQECGLFTNLDLVPHWFVLHCSSASHPGPVSRSRASDFAAARQMPRGPLIVAARAAACRLIPVT